MMAPREEIEDRGMGARAPRQPMRKRVMSSRERQQYLYSSEGRCEDDDDDDDRPAALEALVESL